MNLPVPLQLIGFPGSPYTRKMLALLRFKRIPYSVIWDDPLQTLNQLDVEAPQPTLLPVFLLHEGDNLKAKCDSTPIIREIETLSPNRSVIPNDPALGFINYLLEDFGDEWVTKYMFHFRWHFKQDIDHAGDILPLWRKIDLDQKSHTEAKKFISDLQISRLWVVGSNEKTASIIESSYKRFLALLEEHFSGSSFLLGSRPSSADFSIFGQLTQLVGFDPTSRDFAKTISPRTSAWVDIVEDLSGLDENNINWFSLDDLPKSVSKIFHEVGKGYTQTMLANYKAFKNADSTWKINLGDKAWEQKTFPYQAKCLDWIKQEFELLSNQDQTRVYNFLSGTGCEELIAPMDLD